MKDDDMGNPENITNKTFEKAGKVNGMTEEQAKRNTLETLKKDLGEK